MDKVSQYSTILRDLIVKYSQHKPSHGDIRDEVIIDEAQGHYELIQVGWSGAYRVHGAVLHLDLRDGKVWVEHDGIGIVPELVEAGIPKQDIILAFKHPDVRPHTGYGVA